MLGGKLHAALAVGILEFAGGTWLPAQKTVKPVSVQGGLGRPATTVGPNETLMTGSHSPPPMKMCEIVGGGGRRAAGMANGAVEPKTKLAGPTC